jgi:hypothetical protein
MAKKHKLTGWTELHGEIKCAHGASDRCAYCELEDRRAQAKVSLLRDLLLTPYSDAELAGAK